MITLTYNEKYKKGQISSDFAYLSTIRNHFSEKNPGYEFAKRKYPHTPERLYAITKTGLFDLGLYQDIRNFLVESQITEVEIDDSLRNALDCGWDDSVIDDLALKHRDYGLVAVSSCLREGRGTIVSATGSGKSFLTASLIHNIFQKAPESKLRALIIVPGVGLVKQLWSDFKDYSVPFSYSQWTGKTPLNLETDVIICNSEIIVSQFAKQDWIRDVDLVIVDECHQIKKSNEITKFVSKIHTPNKFGFTGTLPKTKSDYWKIIGLFGPVIFEKNSAELREQKHLADVKIKMIKVIHPPMKKMEYREELEYLENCEERNQLFAKLVHKMDGNSLTLVDSLEYGERLKEILTTNILNSFFVKGDMPVDERIAIISKMESQNNVSCVAMSSIFSTGVNIKNLSYIFFTSAKKSFIRIVQSIGRGLRLHENKKHLTIFDIYDNLKYSSAHAEERKKIYDEQKIEWKEIEYELRR